jgi:hypothetical protein
MRTRWSDMIDAMFGFFDDDGEEVTGGVITDKKAGDVVSVKGNRAKVLLLKVDPKKWAVKQYMVQWEETKEVEWVPVESLDDYGSFK